MQSVARRGRTRGLIWAAGLAAALSAAVGCADRYTFEEVAVFNGKIAYRYHTDELPHRSDIRFARYVPKDEPPVIANLRITAFHGQAMSAYALKNVLIGHVQQIDERFTFVHVETGDRNRYQLCLQYIDEVGQPLFALDVVEGALPQSAIATRVVRKLDTIEARRQWIKFCQSAKETLGQVWQTHRGLFPRHAQPQLAPSL